MNKEINVEVAKLEIMLDVCRRDKDALNFKLAAMQARIEKLEHLEAVAIDVNQWLCDNGLRGTAHQRCLEQALEGDK